MRFQPKQASYVSRLSSRIELLPAKGGARAWEQSLGEAEDDCLSRRRDNYVNDRVVLPTSVPPGDYRLRLIVTDLVAGHSASAELPLTIAP